MTLTQRSKEMGRSGSYLHVMKSTSPEKLKALMEKGSESLESEASDLTARVAAMYFEVTESKNMTLADFYRKKLKTMFKAEPYFINWVNRMAFKPSILSPRVKTIEREKFVLKKYEEYRNEKRR